MLASGISTQPRQEPSEEEEEAEEEEEISEGEEASGLFFLIGWLEEK